MEELNRTKSGVVSRLLPSPVSVATKAGLQGTQRRNFFAD